MKLNLNPLLIILFFAGQFSYSQGLSKKLVINSEAPLPLERTLLRNKVDSNNSSRLFVSDEEFEALNPRSIKKLRAGGQLFGPTILLSGNISYFITHNINIETGLGFSGAYAGGSYYFGKADKRMKFAPYLGVKYAILFGVRTTQGSKSISGISHFAYTPLGVQYMTDEGEVGVSFELAGFFGEISIPWVAVKVSFLLKYFVN